MEELYERYFDLGYKFCLGYMRSGARAEDMVQETFIAVINKAGSYDPKRRFRTWFLTIAANHCKNALRNERNRMRIVGEQDSDNLSIPRFSLDEEIIKSEINKLLKTCNDKEQRLYHLRFEMELSQAEIAEIMEIPIGSVKSGLFHLVKKVRNQLKENQT